MLEWLINGLSNLSMWALALDALLVLLSVVPRARPVTGAVVVMSALLFGATGWLIALDVTWTLWGGFWTLVGLLFFGVGPVFMALVALALKSAWAVAGRLLAFLAVGFVLKLVGSAILAKAPQYATETLAG